MTTLTPEAVQALAQQAAESPAHLDPVLVHQVCQEWQIGQQAASLQRCIVEAAYQDKLKAEQQRDAALAERDDWKAAAHTREAESNTWMRDAQTALAERDEAKQEIRHLWATIRFVYEGREMPMLLAQLEDK